MAMGLGQLSSGPGLCSDRELRQKVQGRQPGWSDEQYGRASFWARLVFDVGTSKTKGFMM